MARITTVAELTKELYAKQKQMAKDLDRLQEAIRAAESRAASDPTAGIVEQIKSRVDELAQREPEVRIIDQTKTITQVVEKENPFDASAIQARINEIAETIPELPEQDYQLDLRQGKYRLRQPDGQWSPWYSLNNSGGGISSQQVQDLIDQAFLDYDDIDTRTNVSEDGTQILSLVTDINFTGRDVAVADDGDGSVTVTVEFDDSGLQAQIDTNTTNIDNILNNGAADQNLIESLQGDTGLGFTAGTPTDTVTFNGANGISVDVNNAGQVSIDGAGLQTQITQNANDIADLDTRVTTNEGDITNLDNRVTNIENGTTPPVLQTLRTEASASQTLNSGVLTTLDFDQETVNTAPGTFTVAANGVVTVNQTGIYLLTAGVVIQASLLSAVSETDLYIRRNGTDLIAGSSDDSTLGVGTERALSCSTTFALNAGDTIEAVAGVVSALGVGNILALLLPALFGNNAEPINHLSITRIA